VLDSHSFSPFVLEDDTDACQLILGAHTQFFPCATPGQAHMPQRRCDSDSVYLEGQSDLALAEQPGFGAIHRVRVKARG
jgi:hypothetical protein